MKEFYVIDNEQQRGPYTILQLADLKITPETEVWCEGMEQWQQAGDVSELTSLLQRLEFERHVQPTETPSSPLPPPIPPTVPPAWQASGGPTTGQPRRHTGLKWIVVLLIEVALLALLVATCPSRDDHREAMVGSSKDWVSDKVSDSPLGSIFGELVKWAAGNGADLAIDQLLVVDNYFVCSVGHFNVGEKPKTVSFGILGHVFTFGKDDIEQVLQDALQPAHGQADAAARQTVPSASDDEAWSEPDVPDEEGNVTPREDDEPDDPTQALIDSLARRTRDEAVKTVKEWAKRQIDKL